MNCEISGHECGTDTVALLGSVVPGTKRLCIGEANVGRGGRCGTCDRWLFAEIERLSDVTSSSSTARGRGRVIELLERTNKLLANLTDPASGVHINNTDLYAIKEACRGR